MSKQANTDAQNELIRLKNLAEQKQLKEKQDAIPFEKKVISFVSNQKSAVGKLRLEAENSDVVFSVRDKATHKIVGVVQIPQNQKAILKVPVGDYSLNYALPHRGTWQGLENLWGTSTSYHEVNDSIPISMEKMVNGQYLVHTFTVKCCQKTLMPNNRNISKSEFFGGS